MIDCLFELFEHTDSGPSVLYAVGRVTGRAYDHSESRWRIKCIRSSVMPITSHCCVTSVDRSQTIMLPGRLPTISWKSTLTLPTTWNCLDWWRPSGCTSSTLPGWGRSLSLDDRVCIYIILMQSSTNFCRTSPLLPTGLLCIYNDNSSSNTVSTPCYVLLIIVVVTQCQRRVMCCW